MPLPGQALTQPAATPPSGGGGFFGVHIPDLGLPQLVGGITGSLTGLLHVGIGAGEGLYQAVKGNPEEALHDFAPAANMARGFASSLAGTALNIGDVATLGQMHSSYNTVREAVGNALGGDEYKPQTLMEEYKQGGIALPLVQNISNIALGAGALGKLAGLGDVGAAGTAAATAGKALDAGYTVEELGAATDAAKVGTAGFRDAGISDKVLQDAGKAASEAPADVSPEAAASRAKLINALHDVSHPYRSLFSEVLSPLGRAATEQLGHEEAGVTGGVPGEAAVAPEGARSFDQPEQAPVQPPSPPAPAVAPETTPVAAGAAAPPAYPVSNELKEAIEAATSAKGSQDIAETNAAQENLRQATHKSLLDANPGPTKTLYHGTNPADPAASLNHWTDDVTEAQSHAGPAGSVQKMEVPQNVVDEARQEGLRQGHFGAAGTGSHVLPAEWQQLGEDTTIPGAAAHVIDTGTEVADKVSKPTELDEALVKPQVHAQENPLGLTAEKGPLQDKLEHLAHAPIKSWAASVVKNLPLPAVKALSKTDRFFAARQTGMVLRERIRQQDVNRREIQNSDAFDAPKKAAAKYLVGKEITLPDGTTTKVGPELADHLIGDALISRLEHVSAVEDAVARHATPTAMEHLRQTLVRAGEKAAVSIPEEWLRDTDGVRTPLGHLIDNSVEGLRTAAQQRTDILRGTSEKGLEHISQSIPDLSPASRRAMARITDNLKSIEKLENSKIPAERARAAAEMDRIRGELQKVGIELAATHATAKAASEAFDLTRIPKNASDEYLKSNAPGITKALGIQQTAAPEEMRTALSQLQRARSTPDVGGMTPNDLYRRGVQGGRAVEQTQAAVDRAVDLEKTRVALQKNLDDMKRSFVEHTLPTEQLRDKLAGQSQLLKGSVERQLNNPAMAQVPAHFKPIWDSITELHADAKTDPELAQALLDGHISKTWDTVLRLSKEQGFDPVHVRSFTEGQVKNLMYDSVRLGKAGRDLGKEITAGTRNSRVGAATRTRSLSALGASIAEATHETHTNALSDFFQKTYAKPYKAGDKFLPGHEAWDPTRQYLLTGEKDVMGDTVAKGVGAPQWQIPKEVNNVIREYGKDYSHGVSAALRKVTNPWKALTLTFSPKWYINHIMGHLMMTVKEGVSLGDWAKAWGAFREGGADMDRGAFMRRFGAGTRSFGEDSGAVAGGLRSELAQSNSMVPVPRGVKGLQDIRAAEGNMAAMKVLQQRIARPATMVDELARTATYFNGVKRGMTDVQALNRTYHSLVDFTDMSPVERDVVKAVIPFYSFQKGMFKVMARLPLDHPAVTALLLVMDKVNKQMLADKYNNGQPLPDYYAQGIDIPGFGFINAKPLNPFQDADTMTSPAGLWNSVNPFLKIPLDNAAAQDFRPFQRNTTVNNFGQTVDDTSPSSDLTKLFSQLPQVKAASGATGFPVPGTTPKPGGPPSLGDTLAGFTTPTTYSPDQVTGPSSSPPTPTAKQIAKAKTPAGIIAARLKANKAASKPK